MSFSSKELSEKLDKAVEHFQAEIDKLRTGRANPALLEDITVDYYGTPTPLKQMATVTTPEPRMFLVQPWDKQGSQDIAKAIQASDLGLNPSNEGDKIRISLPPLTAETRQDLVKQMNDKAEETRIAIRNIREEAMDSLKEESSEDTKESGKKEIQDLVDKSNQSVDEMASKKEKEITTV